MISDSPSPFSSFLPVTTTYNNINGGKSEELGELESEELEELEFSLKMARYVQRKLSVSSKDDETLKEFRKLIIGKYGHIQGHFQEELVQAIRNHIEIHKRADRVFGKGTGTPIPPPAIDNEILEFYETFFHSLKLAEEKGFKEETLKKLIQRHFKCIDPKTIRDKRDRLLRAKEWAVIKIPKVRPRVILAKSSQYYDDVRRFDVGNSQTGLRPTKEEQRVLDYLKREVLDL